MSFARFFICCSSSDHKVAPASNVSAPATGAALSNEDGSTPSTEVKQIASSGSAALVSSATWQDNTTDSRKVLLKQIVTLLQNQMVLDEDKVLPRDFPLEASGHFKLKDMLSRNVKRMLRTVFSGAETQISLKDYLLRFMNHLDHHESRVSDSVFIGMLVVMNNYLENNYRDWLHIHNVHRLILASFVVTYKFLEDIHWNNEYIAKVGGVSYASLNLMEAELFKINNFNVCIPVDKYNEMVERLKENEDAKCGFPPTEVHRSELSNETLSTLFPRHLVNLIRGYIHTPRFWTVPFQKVSSNEVDSRSSPESTADEDNRVGAGASGRSCIPR